jgi:hypothetical protein
MSGYGKGLLIGGLAGMAVRQVRQDIASTIPETGHRYRVWMLSGSRYVYWTAPGKWSPKRWHLFRTSEEAEAVAQSVRDQAHAGYVLGAETATVQEVPVPA